MDRRQARLILFLLLLGSSVAIRPGMTQPANAPQGEKNAYEFRANTVQIRSSRAGKQDDELEAGYGFVVAVRGDIVTLVTADHVVRDGDGVIYGQTTVEFFADPGHPVVANLLGYRIPRQYGDLAVIEVIKPSFALQRTPAAPLPLNEGTEAWRIGKWGGWTPSNRPGVFVGKRKTIWLGFDNLDTPRGSSGGPVLTDTGLVGMVTDNDQFGPALVLPINVISDFLAENRLPWTLSSVSGTPPPTPISPTATASPVSSNAMTLTFLNQTGQTIDIFWLAFDGKARLDISLADGQQGASATYQGHVWSVRTKGGQELHRYVADPTVPLITIKLPQEPLPRIVDDWKVEVSPVGRASTYRDQYAYPAADYRVRNPTNDLAVVEVRIENLSHSSRGLFFSKNCPGNTSLIDTSRNGYMPLHYDGRSSDGLYVIPPDTGTTVKVLFETPQQADPYTLRLSLMSKDPSWPTACGSGVGIPPRSTDVSFSLQVH
jgi:hypothetical protein